MRVKRLEVQGFKSFKDKTVIHFDHSITGIVGPNGCGKSNIVDAFFWVMGEQSYKHMRGSGSDDLIFNGSSRFSPLGMAEATMVLETDVPDTENAPSGATARDVPVHLKTKEIAVTRRVYRSGEGEYFINGVPARLKDIQELFMDTGVGAKGYSVIEQGQIGKIVNAKPEDRRLLIEEAAGIAKYKKRKQESLRKMEATQGNMSRLNDVIQEIERNLGSLERQAQKARQYKKYKDELLDKEMTWGRRKSTVLRQRLDQLKSEREALEQELVGLRAELQIAENTIETERVDQVTDTKAAEELQSEIQQLSSELTRQKSALDLSRRRQDDLSSQLDSLQGEREELNESLGQERERLTQHQAVVEEAEAAHREASERAREMDEVTRAARQAAEESRRKLESAKRELMSGIAQASDLTSRGASLASRLESALAQAERLSQQIETMREKAEAAKEEAERARTAAEEVRASRERLQNERREQQAQVQQLDQTLRQADRNRDESNKTLTKLRSRLQSLEELAAANEGFGDGPKAALDWARAQGQSSRVRPLADSLDVQPGYEPALEGWLESRLENLVAEDADLAIQAITHLRSDKQGRASIHVMAPQSVSRGSFSAVKSSLESAGFEVLGELSQFVNAKGDAAAAMIAGVAVVRELKALPASIDGWAVIQKDGWAVVGLDGASFDPREGSIKGGTVSEANSAATLLGRKRAIAELATQVADAETTHANVEQAAVEARQQLEMARARLSTLQAELQAAEVQAAALDRDVHQSGRTLKDAESQLELTELEAAEMKEEAERARAERESIESKLTDIVSRRTDLESQVASGETDASEKDQAARSLESELQALKITEAGLRERAQGSKRELESGQKLVQDRERRLAEVNRILERASSEREQFTGGDSEIEEKIHAMTLALAEKKEALALVKDKLERASATLNLTLAKIKELHSTGDHKTANHTQLALEFEKLSGELSHLVQNLEEKYGPGCLERPVTSPIQEEMTEPVVTREMTAEEEQLLGEEVERLRERIRRLGEVNVMAIEEFEEAKKRHDYLLTERADLEKSIQNLQEAIEHINKTSEDRFAKAFTAIADRFERLFPIVFGGGQAKLSLVYPEGSSEILDAGVDILAQPPGKKVVNMGLLSGGEKALTAVSLIFAIFMVKPSPFCVLDEVDAPLDDANIGKFNALLREMSVKSQFIVITHNKKTMELNDTLYGVTMEEPGVSKMVSIEIQ